MLCISNKKIQHSRLKDLFRSLVSIVIYFVFFEFGAEKHIQWCTDYSASLSCTFESSLFIVVVAASFSFPSVSVWLVGVFAVCVHWFIVCERVCQPSLCANNKVTNKSDHCKSFNECSECQHGCCGLSIQYYYCIDSKCFTI